MLDSGTPPQSSAPNELRARIPTPITASGIIIDSRGRRWDPKKHPRDRKGRFIETFAEIRAFFKGRTKPDISGRVVAMDPDGTATVQVRGARGEYTQYKGRLVRVPFDKVEMADYKARLGAPELRPVLQDEADQINEFVARMRSAGRDVPGFDYSAPADAQLSRIEEIAEAAEDADLNDIRDSLLDLKSRMRGEGTRDEVEAEVKALLNPDNEPTKRNPDEVPTEKQGPTKVDSNPPAPPTPTTPTKKEPEGGTDSGPGTRRDDGAVPSAPPAGGPEAEEQPEPEPGEVEPKTTLRPPPPPTLREPKNLAELWGLIFGIGIDMPDSSAARRALMAGDRRSYRRGGLKLSDFEDVIKGLELNDEGRNVVRITDDPSVVEGEKAKYPQRLRSDDDAVIESGTFPEPPAEGDAEPFSPLDDFAATVLDELELDAGDPDLNFALGDFYVALKKGDLDRAQHIFNVDLEPALRENQRTALAESWAANLRDLGRSDPKEIVATPDDLRESERGDERGLNWQPSPQLGNDWEEITDLGARRRWAAARFAENQDFFFRDLPDPFINYMRGVRRILRVGPGRQTPTRVVRHPESGITISVSDGVDDRWVQHAADTMLELHALDPLPGTKYINLYHGVNGKNISAAGKRVNGHAFAGSNIMGINVAGLEDDERRWRNGGNLQSYFMPVLANADLETVLKYTYFHEYGHMRGPNLPKNAMNMAEVKDRFRNPFAEAIKKAGLPGPRAFQQKNGRKYRWSDWEGANKGVGAEAYAEHYAEWLLTEGKTKDRYAQVFAALVGLDKMFDGDKPTPSQDRTPSDAPQPDIPDIVDDPKKAFTDDVIQAWHSMSKTEFADWLSDNFTASDITDLFNGEDEQILRTRALRAMNALLNISAGGPDVNARIGAYELLINDDSHSGEMQAALGAMFRALDPEYQRIYTDRIELGSLLSEEMRKDDEIWWMIQGDGGVRSTLVPSTHAWALLGLMHEFDPKLVSKYRHLFPYVDDDMLTVQSLQYYRRLSLLEAEAWRLDPSRRRAGMRPLPSPVFDAKDDHWNRNRYEALLTDFEAEGKDVTEFRARLQEIWPAGLDQPSEPSNVGAPNIGDNDGWNEPPPTPDFPEPGEGEDDPSVKFGTRVKEMAEEIFRGRSRQGIKRGVGNLHLAKRYAADKNGVMLRKGDVVWFPKAGGQQKRPEGDGYIQNIEFEMVRDADGNIRPKLDGAGDPIVKRVRVRHYDPAYIGNEHPVKDLREKGHVWPFPYWDYDLANGKKMEYIPGDHPRAQNVHEQFGLHGRRLAGAGAGRFAPIIGKMFQLGRMHDAVPIQNRFLEDKNGRMVGEGDIVTYNGKLYEVVRPNYPWDNNGAPRVVIRPVAGGKLINPQANKVEYNDEAKDNLLFFRGAGGVAAPKLEDIRDLARRRGITDPDILDALDRANYEDLAKALLRNKDLSAWLDAEAKERANVRDRLEIDNRGHRIPPGHVPVTPEEYMWAQANKADAVILHAARHGHFADPAGKPRKITDVVRKDLYGEYVGAEKDIEMRRAYGELYSAAKDLRSRIAADTEMSPADRKTYLKMIDGSLQSLASAQLNTERGRVQAGAAIVSLQSVGRAVLDKDVDTAATGLRDAIDSWAKDFDDRNRGAAAPPAPPAPPAAPSAPSKDVNPSSGGPSTPDMPATEDDTLLEAMGRAADAVGKPGRPDDNFDDIDRRHLKLLATDAWELYSEEKDYRWPEFWDAVEKMQNDETVPHDLLDEFIRKFERNRDLIGQVYPGLWDRYATVLKNYRDKHPESGPSREREEVISRGPATAGRNVFDEIRNRINELRAGGKRDVADKLEDISDDFEDAMDDFKNAGTDMDRELALVQARRVADRAEAIGEKDLAAKMHAEVSGVLARVFQNNWDGATKDAETAHADGDTEARDAAMAKARRIVGDMRGADGMDKRADDLEKRLNEMQAKFDADDSVPKVEPVSYEDGQAAIDDAVDKMNDAFRAEGRAGREKAREARRIAGQLRSLLDDINNTKDPADADASAMAAEMIVNDALHQQYKEYLDPVLEAIRGNAARVRAGLTSSSGAELSDEPWTGIDGEPAEVDLDGESPRAMHELAKFFRGKGKRDIAQAVRDGDLPDGWEHDGWVGGAGNINGQLPVLLAPNGRRYLIKDDSRMEGVDAEDAVGRLYRALGFRQPLVLKVSPNGTGNAEYAFIMEFTEDAWPDVSDVVRHEDLYGVWGKAQARDFSPEGLKMAFQGLIANGIAAQTDRHGANIMYGVDETGKRVPVFIDNGLMMRNAGFGDLFGEYSGRYGDDFTGLPPSDFINMRGTHGGNNNSLIPLARAYAEQVGRDQARSEMVEFAQRMRDRAKTMRFRRQSDRDFFVSRADWVLNNVDDMLDVIEGNEWY